MQVKCSTMKVSQEEVASEPLEVITETPNEPIKEINEKVDSKVFCWVARFFLIFEAVCLFGISYGIPGYQKGYLISNNSNEGEWKNLTPKTRREFSICLMFLWFYLLVGSFAFPKFEVGKWIKTLDVGPAGWYVCLIKFIANSVSEKD